MGFDTDKVSLGYLPTYLRLAGRIGIAGRVCEVGVWRGDSLRMWQSLFPNGLVVGVDNDEHATWPEDTRRVVTEQQDPKLPDMLRAFSHEYDLIVDDASHNGVLTRVTHHLLWPLVASGGHYVIEDWQIGFPSWPRHDDSMLQLARGLLHEVENEEVEEITYRLGQIVISKR